jgi:acylphosphatase
MASTQNIITLQLLVSGRVQGVGYRAWTQRTARRLGLKGWVRNLTDGRVEVVVEGDSDVVSKLVAECQSGPMMAKVKSVDTKPIKTYDIYSDFAQKETAAKASNSV